MIICENAFLCKMHHFAKFGINIVSDYKEILNDLNRNRDLKIDFRFLIKLLALIQNNFKTE